MELEVAGFVGSVLVVLGSDVRQHEQIAAVRAARVVSTNKLAP